MEISYRELRPSIETGDILLYSGTSTIAKIIQWRSKSPWNHAAVCLDLSQYQIRKCVVESVAQGPDISYISEELEGYKGRIAIAKLMPEYWSRRHAMGRFLFDAEATNVRYDYKTLIGNLVGLVSTDAQRYICSGLAFFMGVKTGLPVPPAWIDYDTPGQYYIPRPGDLVDFEWWDTPILIYKG